MKNTYRLQPWQILLIITGLLFMFGPIVWDFLTNTFEFLADINLDQIFSRAGFFVIGLLLLLGVGLYVLAKDADDKPTSKYTR